MKWSLFTVAVPDISVFELLPIAKAAGLNGIEWRCCTIAPENKGKPFSYWGNHQCTIEPDADISLMQSLRKEMDDHELANTAVMPYLKVGDMDAAEQVLRIANALGAPMMRIGVHGYNRSKSYNELYDEQVKYMEQLIPLLRKYEMKGLVETHHGTIAASASAAYRLVSHFDPQDVGVLFDPGNMVFEGYENHRMGLEILGPYLAHVHVKNADVALERDDSAPKLVWSPPEEGFVRWPQVMADLQAVGYDGFCGVEDFSGTRSSVQMIQHFVSWMNELSKQTNSPAT